MSVYIKKVGCQENAIYEFVCDNCLCEWSADEEETVRPSSQLHWCNYDEANRTMLCPCCGRTVSAHARNFMKTAMVLRPRDGGYLFVDEFGRITNGE